MVTGLLEPSVLMWIAPPGGDWKELDQATAALYLCSDSKARSLNPVCVASLGSQTGFQKSFSLTSGMNVVSHATLFPPLQTTLCYLTIYLFSLETVHQATRSLGHATPAYSGGS